MVGSSSAKSGDEGSAGAGSEKGSNRLGHVSAEAGVVHGATGSPLRSHRLSRQGARRKINGQHGRDYWKVQK